MESSFGSPASRHQAHPHNPAVSFAHVFMDVSIVAVLFFAPLVLGGRHPLGRIALIAATVPGALGVVMKVLAGRRLPLGVWQVAALCICLIIPLVQCLPLSTDLVNSLAPGFEQLINRELPLVSENWAANTLSASPTVTRQSISMVITYLSLFVLFCFRIDHLEDVQRLIGWLIGSALLITLIAILQAKFGNGRFVWWYDHPTRDPGDIPRGPFQNENHLSSLLAAVLPVMLYVLFRSYSEVMRSRRKQKSRSSMTAQLFAGKSSWMLLLSPSLVLRVIAGVAILLAVLTVLATPSRGGAAFICLAALLWFSMMGWRALAAQSKKAKTTELWVQIGAGLFCLIAVAGMGGLISQIEHLSYWRAKIWQTDLSMWKSFPVFGVGVGNHPHVYRAFLDEYVSLRFSTGESSWLQFLVETGIVGFSFAVLLTFIVLSRLLWLFGQQHSNDHLMLIGGILAGLMASCLHAVIDFPWHIPACFVVVLLLVAISSQLAHLLRHAPQMTSPFHRGVHVDRRVSLVVSSLLLVGVVHALSSAIPAAKASITWDRYCRIARSSDDDSDLFDNSNAFQLDENLAELLNETLARDPSHHLARIKLVSYLNGKLAADQVTQSDSSELAELLWNQARMLVAQYPTDSRPYLFAFTASMTENEPYRRQLDYLSQSLRLNPVDTQTALNIGQLAHQICDWPLAKKHFSLALRVNPHTLPRCVATVYLHSEQSAELFIKRYQPSRDCAAALYLYLQQNNEAEQMVYVGRYYADRLVEDANKETDSTLKDYLLGSALVVARQIGDLELQLTLLSSRLELDPRNVSLLLARSQVFLELGELGKATEDLKQCRKISPDDRRVRELAVQLDRRRVAQFR